MGAKGHGFGSFGYCQERNKTKPAPAQAAAMPELDPGPPAGFKFGSPAFLRTTGERMP